MKGPPHAGGEAHRGPNTVLLRDAVNENLAANVVSPASTGLDLDQTISKNLSAKTALWREVIL